MKIILNHSGLYVITFLVSLVLNGSHINAQSCPDKKPYCKDVRSCKEALFLLDICGFSKLDRDRDGVPCEKTCGRRLTPTLKKIRHQLKQQMLTGQNENNRLGLIKQTEQIFRCGKKKLCREMTSCKEATFYLKICKLKKLDGDRDGRACNNLCK